MGVMSGCLNLSHLMRTLLCVSHSVKVRIKWDRGWQEVVCGHYSVFHKALKSVDHFLSTPDTGQHMKEDKTDGMLESLSILL